MRYHLTISDKEYPDEYLTKDLKSLKHYIYRDKIEIDSDNKQIHIQKLSNVCKIVKVRNTDDSLISTENDYLPIIFSEDILSNSPTLKYYTTKYTNEKDLVVKNDIVINATNFSIISLWKGELCHPSNEIIVIKGTSTDLLQQYLYVYLSTIFNFFYSVGLTNISNEYQLNNLEVLIPTKQIQKQIIKVAKINSEVDMLVYFEQLYPDFSSIMNRVELLYSNKISQPATGIPSYYSSYGSTYVKGYVRKDGVYVKGYNRRK